MKIVFLLRRDEIKLFESELPDTNEIKKVELHYDIKSKDKYTKEITTKEKTEEFDFVEDSDYIFINIKSMILEEAQIPNISQQLIKHFNFEGKVYFAFHPPGSKTNNKYKEEIFTLNEKFKNDGRFEFVFFSMGNDDIKTLSQLIEIVNGRIIGEDKIIPNLFDFNIKLLSFWQAFKYNYLKENSRSSIEDLNEKIDYLNSIVDTINLKEISEKDKKLLESVVKLVSEEISSYLEKGNNEKIEIYRNNY